LAIAIGMLFPAIALAAVRSESSRQAQAAIERVPRTTVADAFHPVASTENAILLDVQRMTLRDVRRDGRPVRVQDFPLAVDRFVDLDIEPFRVIGPDAKFVIGRLDGPDIPIDVDVSSMEFFHGTVANRPGSSVYLAFSDLSATGYIDLGRGAKRYRISEKGGRGEYLGASRVSVFETRSTPAGSAGVPLCGVTGDGPAHPADTPIAPVPPPGASVSASSTFTTGLKHLQLAVETDYEYWLLFRDTTAAMDYVLQMYGEVSAVYIRDIHMRVEVVFVRLWDQPDDLFNGPEPLFQFYPYWIVNMGAVPRDAAQLFSGRRDYPFGGQAFLSQLCNFAYGVVGYAVGFQPDPTRPDPYSFDVGVSAHELGHNCGAHHTHDLGLDECDDPNTTPQRGSIMAYCSQTWSGMNANEDNYFHDANRAEMQAHINTRACITLDCNMNGVPDSTDISGGSFDSNSNGIPDECEDCNNNSILDPQDISNGAPDLNGNGVPDECEPDCNNNNVPDDRDILLGTSTDAYADRIPDDCEADCNSNGTSDYTEIQADITLDKNRNAILDSCENCDNDGLTDLTELAAAHELWVATGIDSQPLRRFHATVGVLTATSGGGTGSLVREGQDVVISPAGTVLVSSALDHRVIEYTISGTHIGNFVAPGAGLLDHPTGLVFMPGGDLLVASRNNNRILRYDGTTGAFIGQFVGAGSGGLTSPFGLAYGPNGNLFVTSDPGSVIEYDGATGALIGTFVSAANNGGLSEPRGLAFKPDGHLLVASYGSEEVLEYDGFTGWPMGKWAFVGTETAITQDSPWGIRIGPNGHVYVTRTGTGFNSLPEGHDGTDESHLTDARMFEYDVCTGDFRKTHIGGNDHGLDFATGFDFVPGWTIDCNFNQLQDDCDIASGFSTDANANNVPDECEVDCNNNGVYDRRDIWPYGASLDCNCNFIPDECDLASSTSQDCNGNSRPDECESDFDCDNNSIQDICDIVLGNGTDCNNSGVLDACEAGSTGVLLSEDFESGLPAGWNVSGLFQVTGLCPQGPACNGSSWAYAGNTGSCNYSDGQAGGLVLPPVELPPNAAVELRYCQALDAELAFDFVDVAVNNVRVSRESGGVGSWENRVIDLTPFAGETVTIVFRFQSDAGVSGTLGWQVDNIEIVSTSQVEDCNFDLIPDECQPDQDCNGNSVRDICDIGAGTSPDVNGNLIPDECEICSVVAAPVADVQGASNRFISFTPGNFGKQMGIRVTFDELPPLYDSWEGVEMWLGPPQPFCENSGQAAAPSPVAPPAYGCNIAPGLPSRVLMLSSLQCTPHYMDWHGSCVLGTCAGGLKVGALCSSDAQCAGLVSVRHEGIVPEGTYLIQSLDALCSPPDAADFSAALAVITPTFADTVKDCTTTPCAPPNGIVEGVDVVAVLDKFKNIVGAIKKVRADLDPAPLTDMIISAGDITLVLDVFAGGTFPPSSAPPLPTGPPPCGGP
jgi:DNA-binding beta-propeller fold protein YncE